MVWRVKMNDIEYCWFKNKLQQLILPSILIKTDVHTKYTNKYITTTNRISIYIHSCILSDATNICDMSAIYGTSLKMQHWNKTEKQKDNKTKDDE